MKLYQHVDPTTKELVITDAPKDGPHEVQARFTENPVGGDQVRGMFLTTLCGLGYSLYDEDNRQFVAGTLDELDPPTEG